MSKSKKFPQKPRLPKGDPASAIKSANKFQYNLDKEIKAYKKAARRKLLHRYKGDKFKRKLPRDFIGNSYLYIRSTDQDLGDRPLPTSEYWYSPDITYQPADLSEYSQFGGLAVFSSLIAAGQEYTFRITVRNSGDIHVPSAKLEVFFETTWPYTTVRKDLYLFETISLWLPPHSARTVEFTKMVPAGLGIRSVIARIYSVSPVDIPADPQSLDPALYRHVARRNTTYLINYDYIFQKLGLNLQLPQNVNDRITMRSVSSTEFFRRQQDFTGKLKYVAKRSLSTYLKSPRAKLEGSTAKLSRRGSTFYIKGSGSKGLSLEEQKHRYKELEEGLKKQNSSRKIPSKEFKKVLSSYKQIQSDSYEAKFELEIPDLGLKKGEITAFDVIHYDGITRKPKQGIRVMLTADGMFIQ